MKFLRPAQTRILAHCNRHSAPAPAWLVKSPMACKKPGQPGSLPDVALPFRLDRDQGVLGCRQRRAVRDADVVRRGLDHRGSAERHRSGSWRCARHSLVRQRARLARLRHRRHHHGPDRGSRRHALDRDVRRADGRARAVDLDLRPALAAVDWTRPVHRPGRLGRHQCAALHLCQSLVRPSARLGAGADLERLLSRRRDVAADLRARHRHRRLARDHAVVRAVGSAGGRAARRRSISAIRPR